MPISLARRAIAGGALSLAVIACAAPAQAAQAMGRTPKTVQNALARARRKLRAALQGPTPGSGRKP